MVSDLCRPVAGSALVFCGVAVVVACGDSATTPSPPPSTTTPSIATPLRELAAQRGLRIGTAVGSNFDQNETYMSILRREFNMLTAENAMKFDALHPSRDMYQFQTADAIVGFAEANGMQVRGHTLAWHNQLPVWLVNGSWTREDAKAILDEHVAAVVGRYKGRIGAWDVVNEAVDDKGVRRASSFWERSIGSDYIEVAFRAAHAADPEAKLFYNDYSIEWPGPKQDSVYALIKDLKDRGVPIHGIGFQGHFEAGGGTPSRQVLKSTFDRFAALGLTIHVTELDVRIRLPATEAKLAAQAENYRAVVGACLDTQACEALVVWGLHDGNSWVPSTFPGWGDALLFDASFQPKPAYRAVNDLLAGR